MAKRPPYVVEDSQRAGYRIHEFCARLGISQTSAYNMMNRGELRFAIIAGCRIIPASELDRLLSGEPLGAQAGAFAAPIVQSSVKPGRSAGYVADSISAPPRRGRRKGGAQ